MPKVKGSSSSDSAKNKRPAISPEVRENQLISLAIDVAEEQLRNGTASSQVITHFLKLATAKEQLEREKLKKENKLLDAKTGALESAGRVEELYKNALDAFRSYGGYGGGVDDEEY